MLSGLRPQPRSILPMEPEHHAVAAADFECDAHPLLVNYEGEKGMVSLMRYPEGVCN